MELIVEDINDTTISILIFNLYSMSLKETILSTYIKFFKEKNQLRDAYGEIKTSIVLREKEVHRDLTDDEVKSIIQAYVNKIKKAIVKSSEEKAEKWIATSEKDEANTQMLMNEVKDLSQYLDKVIEGSELRQIVEDLVNSGVNNIGMLMWKLKGMTVDKAQAKVFFDELVK